MISDELSIPLCVDLDGSLIKQDLMRVAFVDLVKKNFFTALPLLTALSKGRAAFKARVAAMSTIDFSALSFNKELIQFLVNEQAQGRKIILATGNDKKIAQKVADYLGFFSEVIASEGVINLTGANKANALVLRFGSNGFDYVGNHACDIPVWSQARKVYVVTNTARFIAKVANHKKIDRVFNW
jgi:hypothetical protein